MRFWIPWGIAAAVTGVAVFFFLAGLTSGSVSSFNAGIWTLILVTETRWNEIGNSVENG